ncbi:hypothetical protein TNCV_3460691 [Trichonephila clavipes]|nr:hypothetical protein TNCV_3460691 [Trichonephila clavipes]
MLRIEVPSSNPPPVVCYVLTDPKIPSANPPQFHQRRLNAGQTGPLFGAAFESNLKNIFFCYSALGKIKFQSAVSHRQSSDVSFPLGRKLDDKIAVVGVSFPKGSCQNLRQGGLLLDRWRHHLSPQFRHELERRDMFSSTRQP